MICSGFKLRVIRSQLYHRLRQDRLEYSDEYIGYVRDIEANVGVGVDFIVQYQLHGL